MVDDIGQVLIRQVTEAQSRYPNLRLVAFSSGEWRAQGRVGFSIDHDAKRLEGTYALDFVFPSEYPASPPFVFEREGSIPKDFGHFMAAGNLCLGAPVEVRRRFAEHKTLLRFIDDQVIPYLFAYSFKKRYGRLPFGELDHGTIGLLQYYMEFFGSGLIETMKLLKCLADDLAPPLMACPCGAGDRLQDCHGPNLSALRPHQSPREFENELRQMIRRAQEYGVQLPERRVTPKRLWKLRERQRRKKGKRTRRSR